MIKILLQIKYELKGLISNKNNRLEEHRENQIDKIEIEFTC